MRSRTSFVVETVLLRASGNINGSSSLCLCIGVVDHVLACARGDPAGSRITLPSDVA